MKSIAVAGIGAIGSMVGGRLAMAGHDVTLICTTSGQDGGVMDKVDLVPHHCGISVSDLDDAVAWFGRVLGFELERKDDFLAPQGVHIAFVRNGAFSVELFQHDQARPASPERSVPKEDIRTLGNKHICFLVPDMEAMVERFRANEVDIVLGPFDAPGSVACFIHGPDNVLIEFVQQR